MPKHYGAELSFLRGQEEGTICSRNQPTNSDWGDVIGRVKAPAAPLSSAFYSIVLSFLAMLAVSSTAACGGGETSVPPPLGGNTQVTVALTGTANDQLLQFGLALESITWTAQKGNIVNLLVAQQPTESIHRNGEVEPLAAVTIPQDIYSSATAIIGGAWFTCTGLGETA